MHEGESSPRNLNQVERGAARRRTGGARRPGLVMVTCDGDQNVTEKATPRRPWRNSGEMLTWPPPPGFS